MDLESRAGRHAALGDERRLTIVDHLVASDRTVAELAELSTMPGNLLAHHLDVLEEAGLIARHVSEGDHRRRYVSLCWDALPPAVGSHLGPREVAFVCTNNSARSQFAAALWEKMSGGKAVSAGTEPASRVHPMAVRIATEFGVDLSQARPVGYESLPSGPAVVISVCDRVRESGLPPASDHRHWSIPDPVRAGTLQAFRSAFKQISARMEHLRGGGLG